MDLAAARIRSVLPKLSEVIRVMEEVHRETAEDLKSMARELRRLSAFMEHVPLAQMDIYEYERNLPRIFRELVYDAENLVDYYFFLVSAEPASADGGGFRRLSRRRIMVESSSNPAAHEVTGGIRGITERAADLFGELTEENHVEFRNILEIGDCILEKREAEKLVGIDGPKDAVIDRLGRSKAGTSPKVVSVVGAGGSGKTALAHAVYRELKPSFQCAAFVTVPLDSDRPGFLMDMLCQLIGMVDIDEQEYEGYLSSQIRDFLECKRYVCDPTCMHAHVSFYNCGPHFYIY